MKRFLFVLLLSLSALPAHAISRYQSTSMTCDAIRAAVSREGAAILRYESKRVKGLPLYGRYVRDRGQCRMDEYAKRQFVPARDTDRCPVLACEHIEYDILRRP